MHTWRLKIFKWLLVTFIIICKLLFLSIMVLRDVLMTSLTSSTLPVFSCFQCISPFCLSYTNAFSSQVFALTFPLPAILPFAATYLQIFACFNLCHHLNLTSNVTSHRGLFWPNYLKYPSLVCFFFPVLLSYSRS